MFTDSMDQLKPCGHPRYEDCGCSHGETATMPPEEAARYYREQSQHFQRQLEAVQAVNEDMGRRIADYITAIRVLTELAGHKWL